MVTTLFKRRFMKQYIAVISDIHANRAALQTVLQDIENRGIPFSNVYCCGDSVGYGAKPNEVLATLKQYNILSVMGNYDEIIAYLSDKEYKFSQKWTYDCVSDENRLFMQTFEDHLFIEKQGVLIQLVHGSPFSNKQYVYEEDCQLQKEIVTAMQSDILVMGHTHYPYAKIVDDKLLVNAGSVGRAKDNDNRACYCIIDVENKQVTFPRLVYNYEQAVQEIEESELPNELADLLKPNETQ